VRLGTYLPFAGPGGVPFDAHEVAVRARRVEAAGFDGVWVGDGSYRRIAPWPDPLSWLLAVAAGTESLEVGTAIFQVPLRSPVDLAQRFMTLRALTKDRLTIGVGPGSTATDYAAYGIPFENRFSRLYRDLDIIRRLCDAETVDNANLLPWPSVAGPPRMALGSWGSRVGITRAAREFDGWICSAVHTSIDEMRRSIKFYRELGGQRAILATCSIDLTATSQALPDDEPINIMCDKAEARRRLEYLAELGFDDILLVPRQPDRPYFYPADLSLAELVEIRDLIST
jgi:alkanesulfonate monooxygenase SsuD/methylene tetrahydromethanopterin reductase-like flavin-dependent oxidoreductase (luciferase family)